MTNDLQWFHEFFYIGRVCNIKRVFSRNVAFWRFFMNLLKLRILYHNFSKTFKVWLIRLFCWKTCFIWQTRPISKSSWNHCRSFVIWSRPKSSILPYVWIVWLSHKSFARFQKFETFGVGPNIRKELGLWSRPNDKWPAVISQFFWNWLKDSFW